VKRVSPDTLVVLDAVCAVASEEIQMDNWGVDVVISASQKGLGAPPGLSIVIASQKAMKVEFCLCQTALAGVDSLSRCLRHGLSLSPHTMPAGRSKSTYASVAMLCSPLLQMALYHEGIRGRFCCILCNPPGQLDPCLPQVIVSDNQSQPFPGRASPTASQDEPSYQGRC
jgi:hypothetical protein